MSVNVNIIDGTGGGNKARIDDEGSLVAVLHQHPPKNEKETAKPFRGYFVNSSGSNDLKVSASAAAPQFFYIEADQEKDRYIKTVSFVIADASAALNKFGNVTALSNGCDFYWENQALGTVTIANALQSNWDFIRLCLGQPSFGQTTSAFRASNVSGSSEGYIPVIDFTQVFGIPFGLKLRAGSTDKIVIKIQDNTTGVDQFDAIAYGIDF